MKEVRPVFLFSLPRSGSTVVQRVLTSQGGMGSASEPWVLLPLLYMRKAEGVYAEYGQRTSAVAVSDFVGTLNGGEAAFREELARFVRRLYARASGDETLLFLDKTPRYSLVAREIMELFPDGKFIFLWRNPLAVLASMIETWGGGRWNAHRYRIDLFKGLARLVDTCREAREKACAVRYEDVINSPETAFAKLFSYLELPFDAGSLEKFESVKFSGRLGDPTGTREYRSLSSEPLDKWKNVLDNLLRKTWARRYLQWIGEERLALMGYDLGKLLEELRGSGSTGARLGSDLLRMIYGSLYAAAEVTVFRRKIRAMLRGEGVYPHT